MMVFHMIEELIGTEAFYQAWRNVYADYIGQKVSWDDWVAAFEKTSGMDLSYVIDEWIDRAGAPVLAVELLGSDIDKSGLFQDVRFRLSYSGEQVYNLKVPVRFSLGGYVLDTTVVLDNQQEDFKIRAAAAAAKLEIDPDCHLFRRLYPEEVEPIISAILGNPQKQFLAYNTIPPERRTFATFGLNLTGDTVTVWSPGDPDSVGEGSGIILNPDLLPDFFNELVFFQGDSMVVNGSAYAPAGHTFVLAGQSPDSANKYTIIMTADFKSLPRIGQLIPHYGKYSYLVFEGDKNVGKGQWVPDSSPLKINLTEVTETGQ